MKKSQLRQLVREVLNEEEYDIYDKEYTPRFPKIPRSLYGQEAAKEREKAALQAVDFPSPVITDFGKGNEYIKKIFTIKGMRDLVAQSETVDEFIVKVNEEIKKAKAKAKVSSGVLRKIYDNIKPTT